MSVDNLNRIFNSASEHDLKIGLTAYAKYNEIMVRLAAEFNVSSMTTSAIFSALSPNNSYHGNLRDAHMMLSAWKNSQDISEFKVHTYGNNKRKAWRIAHGENPLDLIIAKKTRNFMLNVYNPNDPVPVTVDGHMINIWRGSRTKLTELRYPVHLYDEISNNVREMAQRLNLIPCQVQCTMWHVWRKMHAIHSTDQTELWDVELINARLGFHPTSNL